MKTARDKINFKITQVGRSPVGDYEIEVNPLRNGTNSETNSQTDSLIFTFDETDRQTNRQDLSQLNPFSKFHFL